MSPCPDITAAGIVSIVAQGLIIVLTIVSAFAVLYRSKTRPKFFTILGSLLAFTSLWLLSVTIAFTVIFATKSARVSASLGGVQLSQAIINAQARAHGVSPVYKDQSYREFTVMTHDATYSSATLSQFFMLQFSPGSPGCSRLSQPSLCFGDHVPIRRPLPRMHPQTTSQQPASEKRRHKPPNPVHAPVTYPSELRTLQSNCLGTS